MHSSVILYVLPNIKYLALTYTFLCKSFTLYCLNPAIIIYLDCCSSFVPPPSLPSSFFAIHFKQLKLGAEQLNNYLGSIPKIQLKKTQVCFMRFHWEESLFLPDLLDTHIIASDEMWLVFPTAIVNGICHK